MAKKGFRKYLSYDDGKNKFQLPTAEYRYFSDAETNEQVAQKSYDIADTIKRNPSVISTEGDVAKRNLKKFDAT